MRWRRSSRTAHPTPMSGWSIACWPALTTASAGPDTGWTWSTSPRSHGHDQDRIRPNAWPYRDYLIEAFNQDRPFARFIEEQVAADVLFPDEPRLVVALGMIAAGPWDESSLRDIREDSIDRRDRPLHRPRRHGLHGDVHFREHDGPLCALPRPQVRPDLAGGLLRTPGRSSPAWSGPIELMIPTRTSLGSAKGCESSQRIMPARGPALHDDAGGAAPASPGLCGRASEFVPDGTHKPAARSAARAHPEARRHQ